jgi:uncharacterized membrane protein YecN with MAPEG domain
MELPALITMLALLETLYFSLRVGMARGTYGVDAPATTGPPEFDRVFRVHQNTLEQLIIFLPALWVFSFFVSPTIGAVLGVFFVIGRPIYAISYVKDPASRTLGFVLGYLATVALVLGALGGAIYGLL